MLEREFKCLVTHDFYASLIERIPWDRKLHQINFYYANDSIQDNFQNACIRVRCCGRDRFLQIKVKVDQRSQLRISEEYEAAISDIPEHIPQDVLSQTWNQYVGGGVWLQGFLATERAIKRIGEVTIMIDRNSYNNTIDYEIELECKSDSSILQMQKIMHDTGLIVSNQTYYSKYERFCQSLNL